MDSSSKSFKRNSQEQKRNYYHTGLETRFLDSRADKHSQERRRNHFHNRMIKVFSTQEGGGFSRRVHITAQKAISVSFSRLLPHGRRA